MRHATRGQAVAALGKGWQAGVEVDSKPPAHFLRSDWPVTANDSNSINLKLRLVRLDGRGCGV